MGKPRSAAAAAQGETLLTRSVGDPAAFAEFYTLHCTRVSVYFVRRILDPEVALDLTAETFALALERRRQFRGRTEEEEQGWLFAIARSLLHGYWRQGQVEQTAVARLGLERPSLGTEDIEFLHRQAGLDTLRGRLSEALDAVAPDQAAAIRARVSRGLRTMQRFLGDPVPDGLADT